VLAALCTDKALRLAAKQHQLAALAAAGYCLLEMCCVRYMAMAQHSCLCSSSSSMATMLQLHQ
jgi:hypothetical protein